MKPTTIIDSEGIVTTDTIPHTHIYGGKGAHGSDLLRRGLLPEGTSEHDAHHIILPITIIEGAVLQLLDRGISQEDLISFSGVMAKAPNGTPSVHFLFGPAATTKLKVAIAMETFGTRNKLIPKLLVKAESQGIRIIETSKIQHDSKMAVIQGLVNLWLVMVGTMEDADIQTSLIIPWKTPAGTVVDMIHANPFAEQVIKEFLDSLTFCNYDAGDALQKIVDTYLTAEDIENFGTPNSERVMHCIAGKVKKIILPKGTIEETRKQLNTRGHHFLAERIQKIRK